MNISTESITIIISVTTLLVSVIISMKYIKNQLEQIYPPEPTYFYRFKQSVLLNDQKLNLMNDQLMWIKVNDIITIHDQTRENELGIWILNCHLTKKNKIRYVEKYFITKNDNKKLCSFYGDID